MSRKIRLLLCDDHALFRAGIRAVLRDHPGLEVVGEAADGRAAIEEVGRLQPDVVLLDVMMPQLGGFEATRRIKQAHPRVKVLVLTMYAEKQLVARCLAAGASGYVLKDVPVSQLAYAVEAVARGERYLSPAAVDKVIGARGQPIDHAPTRYDVLTDREREVLKLLADGLSMKEVAITLEVSVKTVEVHKYNLARKLGVRGTVGLIKWAIAQQLVHVPVFEDLLGAPSRKDR